MSEGRVAVMMGGLSAERNVSLGTGRCVLEYLTKRYRCTPVVIESNGRWRIGADAPQLDVLEALAQIRENFDIVFNALHGPWGEDGCVQGLLKSLDIAFTGPDVIPAAVTMDKSLTKDALRGVGLETPRSFCFRAQSESQVSFAAARQADRIPRPWFVKPNRLGSSVGCARIDSIEDLLSWWNKCAEDANGPLEPLGSEEFLVEELVEGRELTCAVLSIAGESRALPPIEIRPRGTVFFDYEAKYTPGATDEICPAPIEEDERTAVEALAIRVHRLFGCDPLSRTDFIRRPDGSLSILEINTLPGMTKTSLVPLAASAIDLPLEDLFSSLVDHGLARAARHERQLQ